MLVEGRRRSLTDNIAYGWSVKGANRLPVLRLRARPPASGRAAPGVFVLTAGCRQKAPALDL